MRQKVIIAFKQSDKRMYDPNFFRRLFLRTIGRKFASPYILSEIKFYLKLGISGEALINICLWLLQQRDREENFAVRSRKNKGDPLTVSASDSQSGNESSTPSQSWTKLFKKFEKRMFEMESQLKSLTVNTQQQGLGNMDHNSDLRCKKCKEKNLNDC